jgi:hypothetical protein
LDRRGIEFSVNPFCSGFCESNIFDFSLSFIIFSIIFEYVGVMVIYEKFDIKFLELIEKEREIITKYVKKNIHIKK